ncbi:MAG TPA: hypothetical protein VL403_02775 [Candidatus Kryptonia bacterium]|nr:hypothetical protein [Candidatus Kryptonia bacterium]
MSRTSVVAIVLLAAVLTQAVCAKPARALDEATTIAVAVVGGVTLLVTLAWVGTRMAYPEQVHMLAPGQTGRIPESQTERFRFGPACPLPAQSDSESMPLLCW